MALIDKETIRKEIQRLEQNILSKVHHYPIHRIELLNDLLAFLDTLPEQPVEMDNEEKIRNFFDAIGDCGFSQYDILRLKSIWEDMGYSIPKQEQPVECLADSSKTLEQPAEWLEEEILSYIKGMGFGYGGWVDGLEDEDLCKLARHFAEWQYQKDRGEFAKIKAKTWCEGFDACKEQMMKDAVETQILTTSFINLPKEYLHQNGIQAGDKVRIIIVKEDEK